MRVRFGALVVAAQGFNTNPLLMRYVVERDFCLKDPDIRMDGGSSTEPDFPELDAMDYRSEYSMMNDAHGSTNVKPAAAVLGCFVGAS